jgi:hypothetical protein
MPIQESDWRPRFRLCGAFLQNFAWLDAYQSQRHITFIATEEVKLYLNDYGFIGTWTSLDYFVMG